MAEPAEIEVPVGVIRYLLTFDAPPEIRGNLMLHSPEMDRVMRGDALAKPVIVYCVDERRLRALLLLAQGGEDVDLLMVSVDAAALEPHVCPEHPEDEG